MALVYPLFTLLAFAAVYLIPAGGVFIVFMGARSAQIKNRR